MRFLIFPVIVLFLLPITAKEEKNSKKKIFLKVSATIVTGFVSDRNWEEKLFGNAYEEPDEETSDESGEKQDDDVRILPEQINVTRQRKETIKTETTLPGEISLPDDKAESFDEELFDDNDPLTEEEISEKPDESYEDDYPVVDDDEKIEEKEPVKPENEYLTDEIRKSQRKIIIKMKDRKRKRKAQ